MQMYQIIYISIPQIHPPSLLMLLLIIKGIWKSGVIINSLSCMRTLRRMIIFSNFKKFQMIMINFIKIIKGLHLFLVEKNLFLNYSKKIKVKIKLSKTLIKIKINIKTIKTIIILRIILYCHNKYNIWIRNTECPIQNLVIKFH